MIYVQIYVHQIISDSDIREKEELFSVLSVQKYSYIFSQ